MIFMDTEKFGRELINKFKTISNLSNEAQADIYFLIEKTNEELKTKQDIINSVIKWLAKDERYKEQNRLNIENLIIPKDIKEVAQEKTMSPKYSDGSFINRKKGRLTEYRFMHEGKQISVYGASEIECYNKRTAFLQGKYKTNSSTNYTFGE
jgi:hypothetical protein